MRPLVQKAHTRPVTCVRFNADGDLIFTAGKDNLVSCWRAANGSFLGFYKGHEGAVHSVDCTTNSKHIISGSADRTVRIWQTQTGKELSSVTLKAPIRCVEFASGDVNFLAVQTNDMKQEPFVFVFSFAQYEGEEVPKCALSLQIGPFVRRINVASWGPENKTILAGDENGDLFVCDSTSGEVLHTVKAHLQAINDIHFSQDRTHFVTASSDNSIKLWDCTELPPTSIRTFKTSVPMNTAALSPIRCHVGGGGGMEAAHVTVSYNADVADKFTARFWDTVYGDFLGEIKTHFGPMHSLRFSPTGDSFVTGAEDGYSRLHYFDESYFVDMERERAELAVESDEEEEQ
ncbi:hypothetical protein P9112_000424 [Eukaryota sp. TZLM1-RC]